MRRLVYGSAIAWLSVAVAAGTLAPGRATAAEGLASAWTPAAQSRARLLAGHVAGADGRVRVVAGLEIALAPKWKTYWRMPGDAGVPPALDWSGSRNLAEARVLYPAPQVIRDQSGVTIGYATGVILPVEVRPLDPAEPVRLELALEYGVCLDICIPVEARLRLDVPPAAAAPPAGRGLLAALAQVPRRAGALRAGDPSVSAVTRRPDGLTVVVAAAAATAPVTLLAEAPDGLYLAAPDPVAVRGGRAELHLPVAAADLAGLRGKSVTLTLLQGAGASETTWIID